MSFSEYMMSSTGNPIVDAEKYTNKPVSIDEAGKCIQNAKSYTREELVEVMARALCKYDGLNPDAGSALTDAENWYNYVGLSKAALAALEAIGAVKVRA